jgi:hypothetical protein
VPRAKDAATERRQIAHGVALIQVLVGQQTGTAAHQWTHRDRDILPNLSVNTWTYLTLMEHGGLLHFHRVAKLSSAGSLIDPRNTAVLQEIGGQYFAIGRRQSSRSTAGLHTGHQIFLRARPLSD